MKKIFYHRKKREDSCMFRLKNEMTDTTLSPVGKGRPIHLWRGVIKRQGERDGQVRSEQLDQGSARTITAGVVVKRMAVQL